MNRMDKRITKLKCDLLYLVAEFVKETEAPVESITIDFSKINDALHSVHKNIKIKGIENDTESIPCDAIGVHAECMNRQI